MVRQAIIFSTILLSLYAFVCRGQGSDGGAHPEIVFGVSEYDFGELRGNGAKAFYDFVYTNTGSSPLLITGVSTSCTCSKASFSKKPTMPGEKGAIRITYDPRKQGSPGMFYKAVQVFCNTPQRRVIIIIKGSVTQ